MALRKALGVIEGATGTCVWKEREVGVISTNNNEEGKVEDIWSVRQLLVSLCCLSYLCVSAPPTQACPPLERNRPITCWYKGHP